MATIVIKDLTESLDLDREAMAAITGGARLRGRQTLVSQMPRSNRIVDYPPGMKGTVPKAGRIGGKTAK